MINLLPPSEKRQIRAAQTNVLLVRYIVVSLLLAVLLIIATTGVYLLMKQSKKSAEETIAQSTAKSANYQQAEHEANVFNQDLATAKSILDKEVHYSKIIVKIAQSLPSGVVLESLTLDSKTFGQPMTLNALGRNYHDALRLKSSLERSSMFSDVRLQSVSQNTSNKDSYGLTIVLSVTINPEVAKS